MSKHRFCCRSTPSRTQLKTDMESLIKHFKASTSGFALPAEKPIVLQSAERRICVLMVMEQLVLTV
jgi:NADH:ubiquinone oxidoreductase subunit D